jgi:DNA repair protein RecN (Recombination protein N)
VIEELRIRDLGVIADATVPLGPGLTVLTGETGAGKTMVVTALGLLLGRRADSVLVRRGAAAAVVEARLSVDPEGPVAARVRDAGGDLDGEELVLSRTVPVEGRARAHAGGRSVPAAVLTDIADELVAVHGQSDQLLLRSAARQRALLDRFAATLPGTPLDVVDRYRAAHHAWVAAAGALEAVDRDRSARERELEDLRAGLTLVGDIDPVPAEDVTLARESQRLAHADELRRAAETARELMSGGEEHEGALGLLATASTALDGVRRHDETAGALADRVRELSYLASDLSSEVAGYAESIDADPVRLADVETRRRELIRLTRLHSTVDAALAWAEAARSRLDALETAADSETVARAEAAARADLEVAAVRLTEVRRSAAAAFAEQVTAELRELALPRATLHVLVAPTGRPGPDGADDVDIRLAPHRGDDPLPVARAASGGELSRVMLGVEVVVGSADPVPTFVFDEVDAGVGGAAALGIGRRLARLGTTAQVLVVTHLAQVAAYADRHLVVEKDEADGGSVSIVRPVAGTERVQEIARMLSGSVGSPVATAHAEELLAAGAADVTTVRNVRGAPQR